MVKTIDLLEGLEMFDDIPKTFLELIKKGLKSEGVKVEE